MLITKSQVKYIQSLGHKKFRDREGVFVVEGPKITGELLQARNMRLRAAYGLREWVAAQPASVRGAYGGSGGAHGGAVDAHVRARDANGGAGIANVGAGNAHVGAGDVHVGAGIANVGAGNAHVGAGGGKGNTSGGQGIVEVSPAELQRLSALTTPNQVVAIFEKPVFPEPLWTTGLYVVLDGVQDPGNLGTIVRLADWFGVDGVLCTSDSADVFNPKAVQSTMGSISRVPVWYGDVGSVIRSAAGMPVYAALLEGASLYGQERSRRGFIVIGNESKGIGEDLQALATQRITIPRIGEAESLNAAVATGIILSHLVG